MKTTQPSASAFFKTVAIKTIPQITLDFRNEVTIMSEVVHPNIVRLYGLIVEGMIQATIYSLFKDRSINEWLYIYLQVKWHLE